MRWQDKAIVFSVKHYGENKAIIKLFTETHGVWVGMVRYDSAKARAIYQLGNIVEASWQSRLEEQLGFYQCELSQAITAHVMHQPLLLKALYALITVTGQSLLEREPSPILYDHLEQCCKALAQGEEGVVWAKRYVFYEMVLLKTLGFGINLESCAATGSTEDLHYVSPKSAQAVSAQAGAPYHDKLLFLPSFMLKQTLSKIVTVQDIISGLEVTAYFLRRYVFYGINKQLPVERQRFIESLERSLLDKIV